MAVEIDTSTALRIAELLDLFAELPSTPPILTDEARQHAVVILDAIGDDDRRPLQPSRGQPRQGRGHG